MNQTIKLDTRKREGKYGEARIAPLRRGERNNALLTVKVCANGQPYDLAGKTASLVATTAAGKLVGPCPMEVAEAGIARIMLPAALYSAVGAFSGYVEIREGEMLVDTTDSFGGKVIECADLDAEQAAEFTPVLRDMEQAVADTKRATIEANEAASHQPRIGKSDTWEVWDITTNQYVDTGVVARGVQGPVGPQGEPGSPGAPGSDAQATDVRIAGKSITADGVADIPISNGLTIGVIMTDNESGGFSTGLATVNNRLYLKNAAHVEITNRTSRIPILANNMDYAVKAAMCDGKGAAWTDAEKLAARERLGIGKYELIESYTVEEDAQRVIREYSLDACMILFVPSDETRRNYFISVVNNASDTWNDKSLFTQSIELSSMHRAHVSVTRNNLFWTSFWAMTSKDPGYANTMNLYSTHPLVEHVPSIERIDVFSTDSVVKAGSTLEIYGIRHTGVQQ